jgi:hypothetical protein
MEDHDRLLVLETQVSSIRVTLDRQTQIILDRIDDLDAHWRRTCDVRHAAKSARITWALTCIGLSIALMSSWVSQCKIVRDAITQLQQRDSQ